MKKFGFTLAEILVSLGIIGVISALTMPTLFINTSTAKIGPTLAKAVSAFEQANVMMLNDAEADSLEDAGILSPDGITSTYVDLLQKFLKGTKDGSNGFLSKDGIKYMIDTTTGEDNVTGVKLQSSTIPHQDALGIVTIVIENNRPQEDGINSFYFSFFNDGSLRPVGATGWTGGSSTITAYKLNHWSDSSKCPLNGTAKDAKYCAGHIFENNLKVNYKL